MTARTLNGALVHLLRRRLYGLMERPKIYGNCCILSNVEGHLHKPPRAACLLWCVGCLHQRRHIASVLPVARFALCAIKTPQCHYTATEAILLCLGLDFSINCSARLECCVNSLPVCLVQSARRKFCRRCFPSPQRAVNCADLNTCPHVIIIKDICVRSHHPRLAPFRAPGLSTRRRASVLGSCVRLGARPTKIFQTSILADLLLILQGIA
mmetsp:Transcript_7348/g.17659  ORF Transcript_7348/g.17659 Transcript_7348/m.17659 type:complete len:211 (-) Transcript_7348:2664-3296(-)